MKKIRLKSTVVISLIAALCLTVGIIVKASPSGSTWWPTVPIVIENDEQECKPIEEADRDVLGAGFLGTNDDCKPISDQYLYTQKAFVAVLKQEGYIFPQNASVMPIAAYDISKRVADNTKPIAIEMQFENTEAVNTLKPGGTVYALHYKDNKNWELLSSKLNHDYMVSITANSLSPFYFFCVADPLTGEVYTLTKTNPTAAPSFAPTTSPTVVPAQTTAPVLTAQPAEKPAQKADKPDKKPEKQPAVDKEIPKRSHKTGRE